MTITTLNHPEDTLYDELDETAGAYLISHLRPYCENCGTFETSQWRKGWTSGLLTHSVLLCNACGLKYHKNQYCPFCHYIYGKEDEKQTQKEDWLVCRSCGRRCHKECELKMGDPHMIDHPTFQCLGCRKIQPQRRPQVLSIDKLFRHEELVRDDQ
ncbi:hypothetical protein PROFUN_00708 [Planoprotostelium fungivorum]|uniref:GATA-type domain-containing protein n=1 Tax=Planoprotostelium fungivorum TaxID=1890364 RepID=A0A2P6NU42_9EUKA|nr:hypothetical protein PROFUN_00708 [Planoprotostelium fungivorum]